jgi:beta-lactamase regulating signal transducer with metallopeptidase domain/HEAT repeat protein
MMPNFLSSVFALPTSNLSMLMTLAKATIILLAAIAITVTMRRASAGSRHLVWLVTLGTLLLVPALTAWGPLRLAILPPARVAASPVTSHVATPSLPTPVTSSPQLNATPKTIASNQNSATDDGATILSRIKGLKGFSAVIAIWAVIVVLIAGWLMYGALAVRGIVRRARPLDTQDWLVPLYEVSDRLELDEAPRLLRSEDAKMPFACGVFHPTIVLPAECDNWTADRRLAVLLHELAHVRRHDLAGHTLGRFACAIYWFHPLVWTAAKQLRSESERACDDLALACGARASDYAEHLLDIVTSVRHDRTPAVALAMARRKEFEGRMLAILDPELRHSSPSRWQSAALIASLAVVAIVVGAAAPAPRAEVLATIGSSSARAKDKAHSAIDKSAAPTWQKNEDVAAPAQKPAPAYPNSGVRGVASMAQQMIERFSQNTQTQTTMQSQTQTHTEMQGPAPGEKAIDKQIDKQVDGKLNKGLDKQIDRAVEQSLRRQERSRDQGTGRADDRPQLLANVLKTDTSASLRKIAAWGLSEYAESSIATEALATALRKDPNSSVREMAAWSLSQADRGSPTAIDALIAALHGDSEPKVRATALWALGEIGDARATDAVMASLSDPNAAIRTRAVWAFGQMSPHQAPAALIALLRDSDPRVREITAWALFEIEDPAAVPALNAALHAETDKNLQVAYIRALAATGEKSVDAIRGLLDSKDPAIRSMAVRALAGGRGSGPWPWPWPEPRPYP